MVPPSSWRSARSISLFAMARLSIQGPDSELSLATPPRDPRKRGCGPQKTLSRGHLRLRHNVRTMGPPPSRAPGPFRPTRLGQWEVIAKIAGGGMSAIYLGRRAEPAPDIPNVVALKIVR